LPFSMRASRTGSVPAGALSEIMAHLADNPR
jgi:hypothetical protein